MHTKENYSHRPSKSTYYTGRGRRIFQSVLGYYNIGLIQNKTWDCLRALINRTQSKNMENL